MTLRIYSWHQKTKYKGGSNGYNVLFGNNGN